MSTDHPIRMRDVFVPGGQPEHTYVSRTSHDLEKRLHYASDNLCKLVSVTGPTKSGKTVLTQKIYPRHSSLWIDGGSIMDEVDLWRQVVDQLEGSTAVSSTTTTGSTRGKAGELGGGLQLYLFNVEARIGKQKEHIEGASTTRSRELAPKAKALEYLRESQRALVIDDFHYLTRPVQGDIVRALKATVFEGHPIILLAIPHRRYDAIRVNKEMTGRVQQISIPAWSHDELCQIPEVGFPLLDVHVENGTVASFADECLASPHLMQEFCRELCDENGIQERHPYTVKLHPKQSIQDFYRKVAGDTSKTVFDRLAKGPRQRSDRKQREFKDGSKGDIYVAVLRAIATLNPGTTTLEYEQIRSALRELLVDLPSAQQVSHVLEKMSTIQADEIASAPVLDWEKDERRLHITDPFFAFYLRWSKTTPGD